MRVFVEDADDVNVLEAVRVFVADAVDVRVLEAVRVVVEDAEDVRVFEAVRVVVEDAEDVRVFEAVRVIVTDTVAVRVFVAEAVAEGVAVAVAEHETATAGRLPHGHTRTQSGIQALVAREAEHVLAPPSIMALPGKNVEQWTGDLRGEAPPEVFGGESTEQRLSG